jgi:hypothetical protein
VSDHTPSSQPPTKRAADAHRAAERPASPVTASRARSSYLATARRQAAGGLPSAAGGLERPAGDRPASPSQAAFDGAEHEVAHDRGALDDAQGKVDELERRLATELAQIGPALTAEQKAEYIEKFRARDEYRKALAAKRASEGGLEGDLAGGAGRTLERRADHGDDRAAKELCDSYRALAAADLAGARAAMIWAHRALADERLGHHADVRQILAQAEDTFARALLDELEQRIAGGDRKHLAARIAEAARTAKEELDRVRDVVALGNLPQLLGQLEHELASPLGAKQARKLAEELKGEAPMVKRVAVGLFSFAGVAEESRSLGRGELEALALFREDAEALLEALKGAKRVQQIEQQLGRFARTGGAVSAKVLPLLGVVGGAAATESDLRALLRSQSVGHIAMFVGDFLSTVGSALELAPPPVDLIGGALGVIGGAVTAIATLFGGPSREQEDEREILGGKGGMGFSKNQVGALTGGYRHADEFDDASGRNLALAERAGLSPRQIQSIAERCPEVFSREWEIERLENARKWLAEPSQGGLKLRHLGAFLEAAVARSPGGFAAIVTSLAGGGSFGDQPAGPSPTNGAMFDWLLRFWRLLGRQQFRRLPSDAWRTAAGVSRDQWKQLFAHL